MTFSKTNYLKSITNFGFFTSKSFNSFNFSPFMIYYNFSFLLSRLRDQISFANGFSGSKRNGFSFIFTYFTFSLFFYCLFYLKKMLLKSSKALVFELLFGLGGFGGQFFLSLMSFVTDDFGFLLI